MRTIRIRDKDFVPFINKEKIAEAVELMAMRINKDMVGKDPLFVVVLNGAFIFASDLMKNIKVPCEITFVKLSSYLGTQSTNTVRELIGLDKSLANRNIVIVEDIIDSGLTMGYTMEKMRELNAADVRIATLLYKPEAFTMSYNIDYIGIEIPNDFIVGYGLDYDGYGRNLPEIWQIKENGTV